jgi:hypothetical protein
MKRIPFISATIITAALLVACNDKNEDVTNDVNHAGSVESSVTVQHLDSLHDILLTKHKVWSNYHEFKNIEYKDTIPALGIENATGENQDGDTQSVRVKKDYEIFITVK